MFVEEKAPGEAQEKIKPSLRTFLAWAEKQPADKQYNYLDSGICACGQFAAYIGQQSDWMNRQSGSIWCALDDYAHMWPRTFGALAGRLRATAFSHRSWWSEGA
jgi:hypothetical protein